MTTTPIQFGAAVAPAVESAAASLNTAVASAEQAAETEVASAQAQATSAEAETKTAEASATAATALVHTHQTILKGIFSDLAGFQNMGKAEVYAVVQRWQAEFNKL